MGTHTWDKQYTNDVQTSYSRVKWGPKSTLFVVHRDFAIPPDDVARVAAALGNNAKFVRDIPTILTSWLENLSPAGARGVAQLIALIPAKLIGPHWEWRFGISPIPSNPPDPNVKHIFEVRMIFNSKKIALSRDLDEDDPTKPSSDLFHAALRTLHHQNNVDFLLNVFPDGVHSN